MNKPSLLLLGGALFSAQALAAEMDIPHFYGRADISVNSTEEGAADSVITTQSNSSRLGLHNTHALSDTLDVFYRLAYEVQFDERLRSSDRGFMRARNAYVGLKGGWGKVFLGIHDTPLKKAEQKVDVFSDMYLADIKNVLRGQDRVSDTINIMPAKFGGLQTWFMLVPGEGPTDTGSDAVAGPNEDGIADALSMSVSYKTDPVQFALAYDTEVKGREMLRASVQGAFGPLKLGALVQEAERSSGAKESGLGYVLSAAYKLDDCNVLKLQYVSGEDDALADGEINLDPDDNGTVDVTEAQMFSVGIDHKIGKSSKVYAYYSERVVDEDLSQEFSTIGVGLRHDFGKKK